MSAAARNIRAVQLRAGDDLFGAGRVLRVRTLGGRSDNAVQADIEGGAMVILDRDEEVTVRREVAATLGLCPACGGPHDSPCLALPPEHRRQHKSDCAVHNEPAFPAGPCNCGATS